MGRIGKGVLTTALAAAELALDGLPIPGAKSAVSGLLRVIEGVDVSEDRRGCVPWMLTGFVHR